jgi:mono/diheme cytochrome c family protein
MIGVATLVHQEQIKGNRLAMNRIQAVDNSGREHSLARALGFALLLAAVALGICAVAVRVAIAGAQPKTTQEGVYTDEQAARGKAQYNQNCSACHMEDLSGSGQALPLAGDAFTQVWEGQSVYDLFDLVRTTMPQDKPGSLSPDTSLDIVTYLLQYNGFPTGKEELKNDPDTLKSIKISSKKTTQ